jgi:glycosyltransferase involved in cell wall biosynthesis
LQSLGDWWLSEDRNSLVDDAIDIDPEIGSFELSMPTLYPPLYDKDYIYIKQMLEMLNSSRYNCIILVPFGKLGGADFVSGILSKSLQRLRSTLIIRTDSSEWERPDWYHHEVSSLDLSGFFKAIHSKVRALYTILTALNPDHIFNVNSRLGFELFRDYGRQLSSCHRLHCYYFCSDLDQRGNEGGYPVHFFRQVLPFLATAMIDSRYLMDKLVNRYSLPANQQRKLHLVYSPCSELDQSISQLPVVEEQIRTQFQRPRPIILWAGRLDKQKRFDLVIEIAKRMSDVDFLVWGKAVLDDPPDLSELPGNITINKPFIDYSELPLANADGWLYTSGWDGIPTILIKIGSLGMPIVASAVGGIPEILSNDNGWPVDAIDDPDSYVFQLTALLTDQVQRRLRASKLREHILSQHSLHAYQSNIFQLLS